MNPLTRRAGHLRRGRLAEQVRLPGLDLDREYRVKVRDEAGLPHGTGHRPPSWWQAGGTQARGAALERVGLPGPLLNPGEAVLLHLTTAPTGAGSS